MNKIFILNKSFDIDGKFREIGELLETYKEKGHRGEYEGMPIKIINGLTDVLRDDQKGSIHNLTVRVCQFVDKITHERDSV